MGSKKIKINRACGTCKTHYIYWQESDCKETSMGLWFICKSCTSSMIQLSPKWQYLVDKRKKEKGDK